MGNNAVVENEGIMITSDYNFIDVDFFVEYRISEPVKYLYTSEQPEEILKNIAQSCIRTVIASYNVDEVLTTGKGEIQSKIKEMILNQMEEQDLGIQLVNITIQDSEAPTEEVKLRNREKKRRLTMLINTGTKSFPKRRPRQTRLFRMRRHKNR